MDQSLINWIITSAEALIGFILKSIWDAGKVTISVIAKVDFDE